MNMHQTTFRAAGPSPHTGALGALGPVRGDPRHTRGSVYLLVLCLGMILAVIGAVLSAANRAGVRSLSESQDAAEAQVLAASAVEHALCQINSNSNWRTTYNGVTTTISFGHGQFTWQLTDVGDNNLSSSSTAPFLIKATGTVRRATYSTQVHCTPPPQTSLPYNLMTTGTISVQTGASIDSFQSSLGAYGGTNVGSNATVATNSTSTGGVTVSGGTINGSVSVGPGGNVSTVISGGTSITGAKIALSQAITLPTVTIPSGIGACTGDLTYDNGTTTLMGATLHVGNLMLQGAARVKISGSCIIVADGTVTTQNNGSGFEILAGGSLQVYHAGQLTLKSGSNNVVDGTDSSRLQFLNTGTTQDTLQDQSTADALIISPNASVLMKSGFQLYGGIEAKSFAIQDVTKFHQDLSIAGAGGSGSSSASPVPDSWTRIVN